VQGPGIHAPRSTDKKLQGTMQPLVRAARRDLGSLGGVMVGLLVLVAIGGAYSLRSYPIPATVSSALTSPPYSAIVRSTFRDLEEACMGVVNASMRGDRDMMDSDSNEITKTALERLTPEAFRVMIAFFGTTPAADISEDSLVAFVSENVEHLESSEVMQGVNCTAFAENFLHFSSNKIRMAVETDEPPETGLLQSGFGTGLHSLGETINLFGVWLHKALRGVIGPVLKRLPGSRFMAPRRRRGKTPPTPAPVSCIGGCLGCCK